MKNIDKESNNTRTMPLINFIKNNILFYLFNFCNDCEYKTVLLFLEFKTNFILLAQ